MRTELLNELIELVRTADDSFEAVDRLMNSLLSFEGEEWKVMTMEEKKLFVGIIVRKSKER